LGAVVAIPGRFLASLVYSATFDCSGKYSIAIGITLDLVFFPALSIVKHYSLGHLVGGYFLFLG
jgi:hypothetical protein